jgi:hypothetical protein
LREKSLMRWESLRGARSLDCARRFASLADVLRSGSQSHVTEIPNYPTPSLEQVDEQYAAERRRQEERAESTRTREEALAQY